MAYTPELNQKYSGVLRRIAWALEVPMTQALEKVLDHVCCVVDRNKICKFCKDQTTCNQCEFKVNKVRIEF